MRLDETCRIFIRQNQKIKPNHRGLKTPVRCLGFDIETDKGEPYILSLYSEEANIKSVVRIRPGSGEGFKLLLDAVRMVDTRSNTGTLCGAHFMRFDAGVLVYDYLRSIGKDWSDLPNPEQITLRMPQGEFHLRLGNVVFATLKTKHRTVTFVDTSSYFKTSLDNAARSIRLKERKLRKPSKLGLRKYKLEFIGPYALQDARICYHLLRQIVEWWRQYEILPSISAPQMAGRVFLHRYVKSPWVSIPQSVMSTSLLSYHGGKNGFYGGKAGWYHLRSYDIRSAYPWAMTLLPPMTRGQWTWKETAPTAKEQFSFVVISGTIPSEQKYPVIFNHEFEPIKPGASFDGTSITGMEYLLMRRLFPHWRHRVMATVVWSHDKTETYRDLKEYAEEMFHRRQETTDPVQNYLLKLLGNSLYGKFIARTPQMDGSVMAGQLFYPPVASWITALVRCRITELEYISNAVHTSTDGFMVSSRPIPRELGPFIGPGLGQLKLVNEGPCLILRNKLYLHFDMKGRLQTYALHGFQGTLKELWVMVKRKQSDYKINRLQGWRESRRDDNLPFAPLTREMSLHIPEIRKGISWPRPSPLYPRRYNVSLPLTKELSP